MALPSSLVTKLQGLSHVRGVGGSNPVALLIEAGVERAAITLARTIGLPRPITRALDFLAPGLSTRRFQTLVRRIRSMHEAIESMYRHRGEETPPLGEIPVDPDLFGGNPEGRVVRYTGTIEWLDTRTGEVKSWNWQTDSEMPLNYDQIRAEAEAFLSFAVVEYGERLAGAEPDEARVISVAINHVVRVL